MVQHAFLALVRAGLWERSACLTDMDISLLPGIYRLASEQSVTGLVAAGLEHLSGVRIPAKELSPFMAAVMASEQRNRDMDAFISVLVSRLSDAGVHPLLMKGQGVAQCYERPSWRTCGDVDLLLAEEDYRRAKEILLPGAKSKEQEVRYFRHQGMILDGWEVELHGSVRTGLYRRLDRTLDGIQQEAFSQGKARVWQNGGAEVSLPAPDEDVVFVFTHILQHFYKGGIGLRQVCDWCRLLWTYRDALDVSLLASRLRQMRLLPAWRAFAAFAAAYLDMPVAAIPLYDDADRWKRKARRILSFILEVGNFGHNRDLSYYQNQSLWRRKAISLGWRLRDLFRHARVFPSGTFRAATGILGHGLGSVFVK